MRASLGWLRTARQLLPRLFALRRSIRPTYHLPSAASVDRDFLRRHGLSGVIWDVDGTLMPHHARRLPPEVEESVGGLLADPEISHAIVSNCEDDRFAELTRLFPLTAVVRGYATPAGDRFQVVRGEELLMGDGPEATSGTLIRKPSAELIEAAIRLMDRRRDQVLVVGDQYFTDIASANLAGVRSVKVPTLERRSFPLPVRLTQLLELGLYRLQHGKVAGGED